MKKTYIDRFGYQRFTDSKRLFHRWLAEKEIYKKNRKKYPFEFEDYQVHHTDGNKLNNDPTNLKLVFRFEHEKEHGLERGEWDIIRVLVVFIVMLVAILNLNWIPDVNLRKIGWVLIFILGYLAILFVTRKKKGIRKIY